MVQVNSFPSDLINLAPNPERDKALGPLYREFRLAASMSPEQVADLAERIRQVEARYPQPRASLDDYLRHLLHILEVVGPDHVGIGADWDGGGGYRGSKMSRNCHGLPSACWRRATAKRTWRRSGAATCCAFSTPPRP
ncbi:hypothetical protein PBOI14_17370 [Pseudomonas sp. Boi14]|nr:hypothetical protein PBOI14_17370 [Pseudomonas sp. Boi14]